MEKLEKRFGAVIRRRRVELDIGQEDFAHRAGLHRTHVSVIERGLRSPTLAVLKKLADALGTTVATLVDEAEKPQAKVGAKEIRTIKPGRRKKAGGPEVAGC